MTSPHFMSSEQGQELVRQWTGMIDAGMLCPSEQKTHQMDVEPDSGAKNYLTRVISAEVEFPVLVWVEEVDVWPSSGNMPLAHCVRRALGDEEPEAWWRYVLFDEGCSRAELHALIATFLHNVWTFTLLEKKGPVAYWFDDDETIDVWSPDEQLSKSRWAIVQSALS